ncbi:MAG: phosphotransferase [Prevotella sp.]|nr:phosphotransferase [Prevotella sp.]
MQQLRELYRRWRGEEPRQTEKLPAAGSNRCYYRLTDGYGQSVIGCVGTSREENHAFVTLARHFFSLSLPVPEVLAVDDDEMRYLQTDLGATSLFDALRQGRESGGRYNDQEVALLQNTIRLLPRMQFVGARGLDFSVCYPQPEFDTTTVMFDLNYFKYCYLKATGVDFHELRLEEDFRRMASDLTSEDGQAFLYRDFQARNVMLSPEPCFIDFQGGRRGPFYYDVSSFLWQASARYSDALRQQLIDTYYDEALHYVALPPRAEFNRRLRLFVLFRLMQVLGAYGFRGYFERKQHFIQSIPPALDNLRQLITDYSFPYPHLMDVLRQLTVKKLVVRVYSFSYKKGIPQDESGNGGGYVFDCRSTHNPGRYERYKQLTGLDEPVIRFLEDDGEILTFLQSVYALADAHVKRYLERGFTSLMFSFGCTGGQHRSVYSAQHLAEHIHQNFPSVEVRLCHREQGIAEVLK